MMRSSCRVIFALYALLMIYLSLMPTVTAVGVTHADKVGHLLAYAIFTLLALFAAENRRQFFQCCLFIVAFGLVMECLQSMIPGRMMSFWDFVANSLGVVLALIISLWLPKPFEAD